MINLQEIKLDVEEILDEAQSDLDRDIIVTACKSILSKLTLPTSPWVRDGFSGTSLDWYCGYCEGRMTIGHREDCPYADPK